MSELSDYRRLVSDPIEHKLRHRIAALEVTLRRLADATPGSTNTVTADRAFSWVRAVANTALSDLALQTAAPSEVARPQARASGQTPGEDNV